MNRRWPYCPIHGQDVEKCGSWCGRQRVAFVQLERDYEEYWQSQARTRAYLRRVPIERGTYAAAHQA
jgi:hypothetical protein